MNELIELRNDGDGEMSKAELVSLHNRMRTIAAEGRAACSRAEPALARIVAVMSHRTGQAYRLRAMLYSLWNGKPTSFLEVVCLDWQIRKDLTEVILAFGYADGEIEFFYNSIKSAIQASGQWAWFLEVASTEP